MPPPGIDDPPHGGHPGDLRPLTDDLIVAALTARDYTVYTDADGDLLGKWADNLVYFLRLGEEGQVLQVRTVAATVFSIDRVPDLYAFCNAWNHDRLWPKAFVHVDDDGSTRVCGEVTVDLSCGVTSAQLDQFLTCGISTGWQLSAAVAELRA